MLYLWRFFPTPSLVPLLMLIHGFGECGEGLVHPSDSIFPEDSYSFGDLIGHNLGFHPISTSLLWLIHGFGELWEYLFHLSMLIHGFGEFSKIPFWLDGLDSLFLNWSSTHIWGLDKPLKTYSVISITFKKMSSFSLPHPFLHYLSPLSGIRMVNEHFKYWNVRALRCSHYLTMGPLGPMGCVPR